MAGGWDAWTEVLEKQGAFHCGIYGRDDGNPWACKNSNIKPQEMKLVESTIRTKDNKVFENGIILDDQKWTALRLEDDVLVLKGKSDGNKEKTMTVCLTQRAVVLGCNKDASVQGNAIRKAVEDCKTNLEKTGY